MISAEARRNHWPSRGSQSHRSHKTFSSGVTTSTKKGDTWFSSGTSPNLKIRLADLTFGLTEVQLDAIHSDQMPVGILMLTAAQAESHASCFMHPASPLFLG